VFEKIVHRYIFKSRPLRDISIPDGFIGIFHLHNLSGRTMTLGSTEPFTEMSTSCNSCG